MTEEGPPAAAERGYLTHLNLTGAKIIQIFLDKLTIFIRVAVDININKIYCVSG